MSRWLLLVLLACSASAWAAAPPAPTQARQTRARRIDKANRLNQRGVELYQSGQWPDAVRLFAHVLKMREELYPRERYPQGHPDLAQSVNNLAVLYSSQADYARAEPLYRRALEMAELLYPKERFPQGHPQLAVNLNNRGVLHKEKGEHARAEVLLQRALKMRERLYPQERFPQGQPELASSLNILGVLYEEMGEHARAEALLGRALKMWETLYPKERYPRGHPLLAQCLNDLGNLQRALGQDARAEQLFRRALAMREGLYPKERYPQGHSEVARSLNDLAVFLDAREDLDGAEALYRRALAMNEALYPSERYPRGRTELAANLNNLAALYHRRGDYARAEPLYQRTLKMRQRLYPEESYPQGHPALATSLHNLAVLSREQGEYARAERFYRQAVAMKERLYPPKRYPQGHPSLADSLDSLAVLYQVRNDTARAESHFRRSLKMREELYPPNRYPRGHPDLASSLTNLAALHFVQGKFDRAEQLMRRALKMNEGLYPEERYPQGHLRLANSLSSLALLLEVQGETDTAERTHRRALAMYEALYPKERSPHGHRNLARSIDNLAALLLARGKPEKAEPLLRRALKMGTDSAADLASSAPEATALNYLASLAGSRDAYLSATRALPKVDAYPAVWQSKAALARVYERRHLAVLASASAEAQALWNAISSLRRERERLLLAPASRATAKARDQRLDEIDEEIRKKQLELLPLLPELKRSEELARATPDQFCKSLPADAALVDLLRYVHFEQGAGPPGWKAWKHTPRFVAFVVTRRGAQRVELGKAKPIEELLELWRRAIQEGSSSESNYARKLHEKLWSPLKEHLPARASLVYVSPDAALNRLPWSALLDGKSGRILLEEHAVAVVPHGVFLLDRLTTEKPPRLERPTFLVVGGLDYDSPPSSASTELALRGPVGESVKWPALPGSQQEVKQIVALAGRRRLRRREGVSAGVAALLADLPKAQTAHLATHGFFADEKFRTAWQLDKSLFRHSEFTTGGTAQRFGAAARSPMVLSGLVCSGANRPGTPQRGVLTAEAIAGLDLRRLELAVLSACETGLGDRAGGEAVYGLVRGFHVAGTRNVAASLWQVEDESTAALMVLFYRHLWGKEPLGSAEALRRAQLALYREPARIKEWSQGRGPLPSPVVARIKPADKPAAGRTSPARAWAAFVLSGPGD